MQIQGLAVLGGLHQLFGTAPVFVVGVLSQQLFLQSLDAIGVALAVKVGTFLHSCKWSPALWINDIGVLEGLSHVVGSCEGTAGFLRVGLCHFLNLRHHLISFRMSQNNVHAHTCHQADDALGNG